MAHEGEDIRFARPGPVDEALAYTYADIVHGALDRVATVEAALPPALFRPFRRSEVQTAQQRMHNTRKKAGREFDRVEEVIAANRQQGRMLTDFFDYSPDFSDVRGEEYRELSGEEQDYSLATARAIREAYDRPQAEKLQTTTFHLFDSLSSEPQPTGASVVKVLDMRELYFSVIRGQLGRNKQQDPSGNVEAHAIIFPQQRIPGGSHASGWDYPDQDIDQDQRSLAVHYSRRGPDVAVSLVVAIQGYGQDQPPVNQVG